MSIRDELALTEKEYGLPIGTPILIGSLSHLVLGMWADRSGGPLIFAAVAMWLVAMADSYATFLLAALGVGLAGGSFPVGVAYVAKIHPPERQGVALGNFGVGNVGAAVTKILEPFVMAVMGW